MLADVEEEISIFKTKKLFQKLENVHGNGTSLISLIIPPNDQISRYNQMLAEEYGTASNIKSRVNRLSVLGAITSTQQKLKLYHGKAPANGLVIFCGTIITDDGKEKKVTIDLIPHKPVNTSLYLCDSKFHIEPLKYLLESDKTFGFIVMDGNGCLFGTLSGSTKHTIFYLTVDLPKKHGRGGQSSVRFARLRTEKRHNYVHRVAELCTLYFIDPQTSMPNVEGLILAGLADFKNVLANSDLFDARLKPKIIKIVDCSYGGENGFNQAIELAGDALGNVRYVQEKKLVGKFFEEIALNSGKSCFGIRDVMYACEAGAVETLILWEDLPIWRCVKNGEITYKDFIENSSESDGTLLIEWFTENYKSFGCKLFLISDKSPEGNQLVKGFGGIAGIMRYTIDFNVLETMEEDIEEYEYEY